MNSEVWVTSCGPSYHWNVDIAPLMNRDHVAARVPSLSANPPSKGMKMVLVIIATALVSLFFPPAWLIFAGLLIYFFASRKSRRDEAVEGRIKKMIQLGRQQAEFGDLHFEATRSYAIAKGAMAPEKDAASARVIIDGRTYSAIFTRALKGGTVIFVRTASSVEAELEKDLRDCLKPLNLKSSPGENYTLSPSQYAGRFIEELNADPEPSFEKLTKQPTFYQDEFLLNEFRNYIINESPNRDVAESYTAIFWLTRETRSLLSEGLARAEEDGYGFIALQEIGMQIVEMCWGRLNEAHKVKALSTPLDEGTLEAMKEMSSGI